MTLLVRNEEDIVEETIKFHLNSGVDFIIATNNNSTDNTRNILLKYQELGKLELIDEQANNFNQVKWVDRMIKIAIHKYKADWIINVDADEFWYSRHGNLKLSLPDNSKINGVYVSGMHINPQPAGERFAIRDNMKGLIVNEFKCFHSAKGYKKIGGGNHDVKLKFGYRKMLSSNDIFIYHFWTRSIEQYEKKILNTFKAIENGLKDGVLTNDFGFHIKQHYDLYQKGKMDEVYDSLVNADGENYVIDNRLYDFIKNGYRNSEQILANKYFINNNLVKPKIKYGLDKFIISCKRRLRELKELIAKI